MDANAMERLPCGCRVGTDVIAGVNTFLIEPCSLTCPNYLFVIQESERQGKPRTTLDLR